jgi:peptidoglycan/LPS O-acetylase OafA/YrhL
LLAKLPMGGTVFGSTRNSDSARDPPWSSPTPCCGRLYPAWENRLEAQPTTSSNRVAPQDDSFWSRLVNASAAMPKESYRPDIDGLRAIAVLVVLAFHYQYAGFSGGFVGVDVFFVISGYLITGIILDRIAAGKFSFLDFFERRARRLMPALFATVLASFVAGVLILSPEHLKLMGQSVVAALFSVSNVLFWAEADYFDAAANFKPLLHTWSLAVEWQFYLVWPVFLLVLSRLRRTWLVATLAVLSIAVPLIGTAMLVSAPDAVFYLTPFRIGEFAIGGLVVAMRNWPPPTRVIADVAYAAGLAAIAASVVLLTRDTPFPGVNALLPCAGSALVIWAGEHTRLGFVTGNPAAVLVGRMSYSVYLVHWPLLIYFLYWKGGPATAAETLLLLPASLVLGYLSFRFVEEPFRRKPRARRAMPHAVKAAVFAVPVLLIATAGQAGISDGWAWRVPFEIRNYYANLKEKQMAMYKFRKEFELPFSNSGKKRILIIGDSHTLNTFNAIRYHLDRYPGAEFRRLYLADFCLFVPLKLDPPADMAPSRAAACEREVKHTMESQLLKDADWIVYSTRWREPSLANLKAFRDWLHKHDKEHIAIFGRTVEFEHIPNLAMRYGRAAGFNEFAAQHRDTSVDALNADLKKIAESLGMVYIDQLPVVCTHDRQSCTVIDSKNQLLYSDYGHWSLEGADFFGERMADMRLLDPILKP